MANIFSQFTYDAGLLLQPAGLVAASAAGSTIIQMGGTNALGTNDIYGIFDGFMVVDVTAIEVSGNETYLIMLEGGIDSAFASDSVSLAEINMGVLTSPSSWTTGIGRFAVPVRNEQNGVIYPWVRSHIICGGTISTGINSTIWLAKKHY
jgi:hypothetical protein